MIVTTTNDVPGKRIVEVVGLVRQWHRLQLGAPGAHHLHRPLEHDLEEIVGSGSLVAVEVVGSGGGSLDVVEGVGSERVAAEEGGSRR